MCTCPCVQVLACILEGLIQFGFLLHTASGSSQGEREDCPTGNSLSGVSSLHMQYKHTHRHITCSHTSHVYTTYQHTHTHTDTHTHTRHTCACKSLARFATHPHEINKITLVCLYLETTQWAPQHHPVCGSRQCTPFQDLPRQCRVPHPDRTVHGREDGGHCYLLPALPKSGPQGVL